MDSSFKLHTVDPAHSSQKVLHHPDDFPTTNMSKIKEFFKGARPITDGRKIFLKIKASFKRLVEELVGMRTGTTAKKGTVQKISHSSMSCRHFRMVAIFNS